MNKRVVEKGGIGKSCTARKISMYYETTSGVKNRKQFSVSSRKTERISISKNQVNELEKIFSSLKPLFENLSEELKSVDLRIKFKADLLISILRAIVHKNNLWWDEPLGNISINEEIVLEWWNREKKITIYVCLDSIDYIKVWGADMDNEMEDGSLSLNEGELKKLWMWIAS